MNDAMMNVSFRARDYAALGLEIPAEAARLVQIGEAATAACFADPLAGIDYDKLSVKNVGDQVREAALTKAVKDGMQNIVTKVHNELGRRAGAILRDDYDRAVNELRPRYDEAAKVITDAIDAGLTSSTYANAQRVMDAGPDAAAIYHRTRDAMVLLDAIKAFMHPMLAVGNNAASFVVLTDTAGPDTLAYAEATITGRGGPERWLELFELTGVRPALNTPDQAKAVVSAAAAIRQAQADREKAAAVEAAKKREAAWMKLGA